MFISQLSILREAVLLLLLLLSISTRRYDKIGAGTHGYVKKAKWTNTNVFCMFIVVVLKCLANIHAWREAEEKLCSEP